MTRDPVQLSRIEGTHSGFFYQYPFGSAQLFIPRGSVEMLLVETDETIKFLLASLAIRKRARRASNRATFAQCFLCDRLTFEAECFAPSGRANSLTGLRCRGLTPAAGLSALGLPDTSHSY